MTTIFTEVQPSSEEIRTLTITADAFFEAKNVLQRVECVKEMRALAVTNYERLVAGNLVSAEQLGVLAKRIGMLDYMLSMSEQAIAEERKTYAEYFMLDVAAIDHHAVR